MQTHNSLPTIARTYYISDTAYFRLVNAAQRYRYVQFGSKRVKGLSEFLNDLAKIPMEDTRPPIVRERHVEEIRNNRAPTWMNTRLRRQRLLTLTEDSIQRYFLVAYQVGIVRADPYPVGGPDRSTPYPSVALVLEAIGLGWLTPIEYPFNGRK
jgi:hypothetical protein